MKSALTLSILLVVSLTLTPTTALSQNDCSCAGSCAAKVRCSKRGCTAVCGARDACYAACGSDLLVTRFTLKLEQKSGQEVAAALSERTGHRIEFTPFPRERNQRFDVDIRDDDMWTTMDRLYKRGRLTVNGEDWKRYQRIRNAALAGNRLTVTFKDISVRDALSHLSFLTGLRFEAEPGGEDKTVTLSMTKATLNEVISRVSTQTGVKIGRAEKRAAVR